MKFEGEHLLPGQLGHIFVLLAFVASLLSTYSFYKASFEKDILVKHTWLKYARTIFFIQVAAILAVFFTVYFICSSHYFEYLYAYKHASKELEPKYLLACIWEGQEGSFLLWSIWHCILGTILIFRAKEWEAPVLRKYQPEVIICNSPDDRHPDHARSANLVADAAFLSGLKKIETFESGEIQQEWRAKYVLHYIQDKYHKPDFVIDISEVIEKKIEAVKAYSTQFHNPELDEPQTYISTPGFLDSILYRSKMLGRMIGVEHAEGFLTSKMIGFKSLDALIKINT